MSTYLISTRAYAENEAALERSFCSEFVYITFRTSKVDSVSSRQVEGVPTARVLKQMTSRVH